MKRASCETVIERNIWILWLQGFETAPELVKICAASWVEKNPGWTTHLLDRDTVGDFLDPEFQRDVFALKLPPQKTANLIRLYLLSRHGGVWADADCFCARALDDWLPQLMHGGFFAFRFPADNWLETTRRRPFARLFHRSGDRVVANWFLAGRSGNSVSSMFLDHHLDLFRTQGFRERRTLNPLLRLAMSVLKRNAYLASQMASSRLLGLLGTFPYFIFHYHFARLLLQDVSFHTAWQAVSNKPVGPSLAYSKSLHLQADGKFDLDMTSLGSAPVYKFHWYLQQGADRQGSRYRTLVHMAGSCEAQAHPQAT